MSTLNVDGLDCVRLRGIIGRWSNMHLIIFEFIIWSFSIFLENLIFFIISWKLWLEDWCLIVWPSAWYVMAAPSFTYWKNDMNLKFVSICDYFNNFNHFNYTKKITFFTELYILRSVLLEFLKIKQFACNLIICYFETLPRDFKVDWKNI